MFVIIFERGGNTSFSMKHQEKHIALVCNPTFENEKALRTADEVTGILKKKNIHYSIFTQVWPENWEGISEAWIFGGDGTLNVFINTYPHLKLPITIFRCGSGNDFHFMLYGNMMMEEQLEKVLQGRTGYVDAGICNGQIFLVGVGIGFDGAIVKDLAGTKKLAGTTSYMLSILKNIVAFREKQCTIRMKGQSIDQECFMISVANVNRYGGGFLVAPKASITDQLLDVNIVGRIPPLKRMRYLPVVEKGEHLDLPFNRYEQSDSVIIQSNSQIPAHIDGELVNTSLYEIACLPKKFLFFQ